MQSACFLTKTVRLYRQYVYKYALPTIIKITTGIYLFTCFNEVILWVYFQSKHTRAGLRLWVDTLVVYE